MLDTVIKLLPGQVVNGFRIEGYCDRDSKNLPVYRVRCTRCDTQTTMSHRRPHATKCTHCEMQATRAVLAKPPNTTAKLEAVKAYDQSVEQNYAAAQLTQGEKVNPETPAPVQSPQPPSKSLSKLAQQRITEAMFYAQWSYERAYDVFKND